MPDESDEKGRWRKDVAALRAAGPKHILFLCVANSARSQMAEGIARSLASPRVRISSAGSRPGALNPEAVSALAEIGIDISDHCAKGVEDIDAGSVEAVITLCAEEACPAWLAPALRFHWPLPDPAGSADEAGAFRSVRDAMYRRLAILFENRE